MADFSSCVKKSLIISHVKFDGLSTLFKFSPDNVTTTLLLSILVVSLPLFIQSSAGTK